MSLRTQVHSQSRSTAKKNRWWPYLDLAVLAPHAAPCLLRARLRVGQRGHCLLYHLPHRCHHKQFLRNIPGEPSSEGDCVCSYPALHPAPSVPQHVPPPQQRTGPQRAPRHCRIRLQPLVRLIHPGNASTSPGRPSEQAPRPHRCPENTQSVRDVPCRSTWQRGFACVRTSWHAK